MALFGYDISGWQATLNPAVVPGDFVVVKATGGKGYVNPYCDKQVQAARAAGKEVAVYHFVHDPGNAGTSEEEADWFLANTRGYQDGSVVFVMDWEGDNVTDSAYALRFKNRFEAEAGLRLMVYASVSQLGYIKPCFDAGSPIWVAGYSAGYTVINGYNPPAGPLGVPAWATISMWQFTSSGRLPGYAGNLDLNVFYGDRAAWRKLAAKFDGTTTGDIMPTPEEYAKAVWNYQFLNKYDNPITGADLMSWVDKNVNDYSLMILNAIKAIPAPAPPAGVTLNADQVTVIANSLKDALGPAVAAELAKRLAT